MAKVETKFKVVVEGVEEYIDNLETAESLITDISEKLKNGDLSFDDHASLEKTLKELEEVKATLELTNEVEAKRLEILAKENTELGKQVGIVEAQLATVDILNEAYALQDKTIGLAKSEAERLLEITELQNEAVTLATTELGKQKLQAERNLTLAESQAEALAATPGSIRQLNAELEKATLLLDDLDPNTAEFAKAKEEVESLSIQIEGLSRTSKDQREANFALADSFVGTFGQGAALVTSFAGENENLQAVLLKLEQVSAAVGAVQSALALVNQVQNEIKLKQGKKLAEQKAKEIKASEDLIKTEKKETASIQDNSEALKDNNKLLEEATTLTTDLSSTSEEIVDNNNKLSKSNNDVAKSNNSITDSNKKAGGSFSILSKGTDAAKGGFKSLFTLLQTNPFIFIATAVATLTTGLFLLKDKIAPLKDAFDFLDDAVAGFGTVVANVVPIAINYFKALATPLTALFTLFTKGFDAAKDELVKGFTDLTTSVSDAFEKGFSKNRGLRLNAEKEALNKLTDLTAQNNIARLELEEKNADAISNIKQKELQEDIAIQKEKILLTSNLSEAELKTLQQGSDAEKAALKTRLKARGDFNDSLIESLEDLSAKEQELAKERKDQFNRQLDEAKELFDQQKDFQLEKLALEKGTDAQIEVAKIELEKSIRDIDTRIAKGEKVNLIERQLAQLQYANKVRDINDTIKEEVIDIQKERDQILLRSQAELLSSTEATSDKIEDIVSASNSKLLGLEKTYDADLIDLKTQTEKELKDVDNPEKRLAIQEKSNAQALVLEQKFSDDQIKLQKETDDKVTKIREDQEKKERDARIKGLEESSKTFADQSKKELDKLNEVSALKLNERLNIVKNAAKLEEQAVKDGEQAKLESLELTQEQITIFKEKGVNSLIDQFKDLPEATKTSLKSLEKNTKESLDNITKTTQKKSKELKDEQRKAILGVISDVVGSAQQIFQASSDLVNQFFENNIAELDKQKEQLETALEDVNTRLDEVTSKVQESQDNLKTARGSDRKLALANFKLQKQQQKQLTDQKLKDEAAIKKVEDEKKAEQKKQAEFQKAANLANAIISTGLAIINSVANTTLPFPLSLIAPVTIGVLGAVQIATIAATPIPEFATGGFTANEDASKPVGVVHGGEWVAPKWMVKSPKYSSAIRNLENNRLQGYADGGVVQQASNLNKDTNNTEAFDKLVQSVKDLSNRPIYTNVVAIEDEQKRLNFAKNLASL